MRVAVPSTGRNFIGHPFTTRTRMPFQKHGLSRRKGNRGHPLYHIWVNMHQRCENPRKDGYQYYGGAGVRVDPRWNDFPTWLADVGERPSPRHSLDRIDPWGNYEPGNVRWADVVEQRANRRDGPVRNGYRCGHPYTLENTYIRRSNGAWICRTCCLLRAHRGKPAQVHPRQKVQQHSEITSTCECGCGRPLKPRKRGQLVHARRRYLNKTHQHRAWARAHRQKVTT